MENPFARMETQEKQEMPARIQFTETPRGLKCVIKCTTEEERFRYMRALMILEEDPSLLAEKLDQNENGVQCILRSKNPDTLKNTQNIQNEIESTATDEDTTEMWEHEHAKRIKLAESNNAERTKAVELFAEIEERKRIFLLGLIEGISEDKLIPPINIKPLGSKSISFYGKIGEEFTDNVFETLEQNGVFPKKGSPHQDNPTDHFIAEVPKDFDRDALIRDAMTKQYPFAVKKFFSNREAKRTLKRQFGKT